MKQIVAFALTAIMMGGCDHSGHQHGDKNAEMTKEFYGNQFELGKAIPVTSLAAQLEGKDTIETTISGIIDQTCPNAGCWLNLKSEGENTQKITTDHVFFVPLEGCEGLKAEAKGKAYYNEISVEQLKHYALEEGKSQAEVDQITAPEKILTFVATGVMIEGYKEPEGGAKTGTCNHDHEGHDHEGHDHEHEGEAHQ
jgi:hypothetical protein